MVSLKIHFGFLNLLFFSGIHPAICLALCFDYWGHACAADSPKRKGKGKRGDICRLIESEREREGERSSIIVINT